MAALFFISGLLFLKDEDPEAERFNGYVDVLSLRVESEFFRQDVGWILYVVFLKLVCCEPDALHSLENFVLLHSREVQVDALGLIGSVHYLDIDFVPVCYGAGEQAVLAVGSGNVLLVHS